MKKILLIGLLVLNFSKVSVGQSLADINSTFLWGVVNQNNDTSYLFGVLHDLGDSYLNKYSQIKNALRKTDCIVMENVIPDKVAEAVTSNDWYNRLTKEDYKLINSYLEEKSRNYCMQSHVSLNSLQKMNYSPLEVFAVIENLTICDICNIHLNRNEQPIEQYLQDWSKYHNDLHHKIPVIALETQNDVVNANIFGFGNNDLLDSIKRRIQHPEKNIYECDLIENYKNMNAYNYSFSINSQSIDTSYAHLLNERNDKWMPKIKKIVNENKAFIAVGLYILLIRMG